MATAAASGATGQSSQQGEACTPISTVVELAPRAASAASVGGQNGRLDRSVTCSTSQRCRPNTAPRRRGASPRYVRAQCSRYGPSDRSGAKGGQGRARLERVVAAPASSFATDGPTRLPGHYGERRHSGPRAPANEHRRAAPTLDQRCRPFEGVGALRRESEVGQHRRP